MAKKMKVAIIGRTNVGKSTLFNRLTSNTDAIISAVAGTTRDRKEAICHWRDRVFTLIDTGGLYADDDAIMDNTVEEQADKAMAEASLILLIVDVLDGPMPPDKRIAAKLKKLDTPIILVANKAASKRQIMASADFYPLALGEPIPISALTGRGTGDLLDEMIKHIPAVSDTEDNAITITLIGKPNVGKSSLINAILNEERTIVDDRPYTTRDSNDIPFTYKKKKLVLIDTAGIRKKGKIPRRGLEAMSVEQSRKSLKRASIALLVTEAQKPMTVQDKHIADEVRDSDASVIIIGNKWDLIENKKSEDYKKATDEYKRFFNFLSYAPIIFVSSLERKKLHHLLDAVLRTYEERHREITDNALSKFLKSTIKKHRPRRAKGTKQPYIYALRQTAIDPPRFVIKIGLKDSIHESYIKFLIKELRYKFGFMGSPIKISVDRKNVT